MFILITTSTTEIYTLSLHDALPILASCGADAVLLPKVESGAMIRQALSVLTAHGAPEHLAIWCMLETPLDRKSTRLNSSHSQISYAVFCLKKKINLNKSNV